MCRRRSESRAFTLVELLAASALAALLLVATFNVIGSVGRAEAGMKRRVERVGVPPTVLVRIRWDVGQATSFEKVPGGFRLTGFCGLDRRTLEPTHRGVVVEYMVRNVGGRSWLVRSQREISGGGSGWATPVMGDVRAVRLEGKRRVSGEVAAGMPGEMVVTVEPVGKRAGQWVVFVGRP